MDKENSNQSLIHDKGFDMVRGGRDIYRNDAPTEFKKIKVGVKNLDDAILNLGSLNRLDVPGKMYISKSTVLRAIAQKDADDLRYISNFFYDINGVYEKACNYLAFLYRYDWYVVPEIYDEKAKTDKVLKDFYNLLNFLDNSYIKKLCGDIALEVIKNGAYYGYRIPSKTGIILQQLPIKYCRSRYNVNGNAAIEFDMRFFDTISADITYRMKVLNLFPDEFKKGYILYKEGKLKQDPQAGRIQSSGGWYLLNPENTVKFNLNGSDTPAFVNAIPDIMDLDAAQDLDRRKQMQKLLKIIVQKLPVDKNGDLIFDIDEAKDLHNNAVEMLSKAVGVDVLTTFADVDSIDMSDKNTTSSRDDLEKVERTVFNSLGISQNLFNTDGNLSLDKSILNDESSVRNLLSQFNMFFDRIIKSQFINKKYNFKIYMLETTQHNYRDLAKIYKEQTQIGYSKMLPQIALGHSQSFILNSVYFENEVLHLSEIMIPPLMSSTMSGEDILGQKDARTGKSTGESKTSTEEKQTGRPEKPDSEKSEKTIQNKESMS